MNVVRDGAGGKLVIAGGSGFIGRRLVEAAVARGYEVVILSTEAGLRVAGARVVLWDARRRDGWERELEGAAGLVNMSGMSGLGRGGRRSLGGWLGSQVAGTRVLGDAIHGCRVPPRLWIQAGSMAIYGKSGERWCDEESTAGREPGAMAMARWERAFAESPTPRTRRVLLRMGVVLGRGGGILAVMGHPFRAWASGMGSAGEEYLSWIHEHDLTRLILRAVENPEWTGVYVACSPDPLRVSEFQEELCRARGGRWIPWPPAWMARMAARVLGSDRGLALTGTRGDPRRLEEAGFTFRYPTLQEALDHLYPATSSPDRGAGAPAPQTWQPVIVKSR